MAIKLDVAKNTLKGTTFGIINQMVHLLVPFITRTVFIYTLGIAYNGLNSLFSSILSVLNLAELGVGSALVFSMYKPIARGNDAKIRALMRLYRIYYRVIGVVVLIMGIAIAPVLPFLIKSDLPPDVNLYTLYFLHLAATVLSYWLFAYKNSILTAYQKQYVTSIISIVIILSRCVLQITSLVLFRNYYSYLIIAIAFQILTNLITAYMSNKLYPQYYPDGKLEKSEIKEINRKVRNLFAAKLCGVVTNSADSLVISAFLGLNLLGIYNNYYYILTSVMGFFAVFFNSFRPGLGNMMNTSSKERIAENFFLIQLLLTFFIGTAACCFLNLYQPFIQLWIGSQNQIGFFSVILICAYFVCYEYPIFWAVYKDAAGIWREDLARSIFAPIFNLTVNIILVRTIGLNGVLISTVITYGLISGPWLIWNLRCHVISISIGKVAVSMGSNLLYITISCCVSYFLCSLFSAGLIAKLLASLLISVATSTVLFVVFFSKTKEFKIGVRMIKSKLWQIIGKKGRGVLSRIRNRKLKNRIINTAKHQNVVLIIGAPFHPNMGDQAQTLCTVEWVNKNYQNYVPIVIDSKAASANSFALLKIIHKYIKSDDIVICHSGYHMTDIYPLENELIIRTVSLFQENRVVIFPQTINYSENYDLSCITQVISSHKNLLLLCRDEVSYATAKNLFPRTRLELFPDIVTTKIGKLTYDNPRKGILFCMRNDPEAYYSREKIDSCIDALSSSYHVEKTDTTITKNVSYIFDHRETVLNEIWDHYSRFEVVVTDRYHGTIFSLIAGTPVIVLASTDHKLRSGVKWFPDSFKDYVYFAENLEDIDLLIDSILSKKIDHSLPDYFEPNYYDRLKGIIKNGTDNM